MKILKYIGAILLTLIAISELLPIYLIASGLLQGQAENESAYFIGKLVGHVFIAILVLAIASKLYKSTRKQGEVSENGV